MNINIRKLSRMRNVLLNPNASGPHWTYLMIRGLPFLSKGDIRCDLTILRACRLGREFNKTFGHIHRPKSPEAYKVLFGKGLFLMQKMVPQEGSTLPRVEPYRGLNPAGTPEVIEEIKLISATAGEKITIPPGWYHEAINLGRSPLILLNWIRKEVKNDYTLIEEKKGFGYYVVASKDKEYELVRNENYGEVPSPKSEILNPKFQTNPKP